MREFSIEEHLNKILSKLSKKDKETYEAMFSKMQEVLTSPDVNHYKNLRAPLQHLKRVHIGGSFVLVFQYVVSEDKIIFVDFDHHDNIYS